MLIKLRDKIRLVRDILVITQIEILSYGISIDSAAMS